MLHLLLIALPAVGHLNPIKCLAKTLIDLGRCEKLKVVITLLIFDRPALVNVAPYTHPQLQEVHIQIPADNFIELFAHLQDNDATLLDNIFHRVTQQAILNGWPLPAAIIADFFMCFGRTLALKMNIPEFRFMPSPIASTWYLLRKALAVQDQNEETSETADVVFPGIGRVDHSNLPVISDDAAFNAKVRKHLLHLPQAQGVLFNDVDSFYRAEDLAEYRLSFPIKNLLNVGPLVWSAKRDRLAPDENLQWLDSFPPRSVLLVALGSWAPVSEKLTRSLSAALCQANFPVLWAARELQPDINFCEKRAGQLRVVHWIDQRQTLNHQSIGGFLTHCGWNSILESLVLAGVPLICLPLTAEQKLNAHVIQEVWKIGTVLDPAHTANQLLQNMSNAINSDVYKQNASSMHLAVTQDKCAQTRNHRLREFIHDLTPRIKNL